MRRRGFALVSAVLLSMAAAALALGVARETRTTASVAAYERDALAARAAAEAGAARMALVLAGQARGLETPVPERAGWRRGPGDPPALSGATPIRRTGAPYGLRIGAFRVIVSAEAEAGKFDLNRGDPALVSAVFRAAGLREGAEAAADTWAAVRLGGGGVRAPWRLRTRPIETVAEGGRVAGLSPAAFAAIAPFVTVWSDKATPDPSLAPEALFRALPLDADARRRLRAARGGRPEPWRLSAPAAFTVRARAESPDGRAAVHEEVVWVRPSGRPALRRQPRPTPTLDR